MNMKSLRGARILALFAATMLPEPLIFQAPAQELSWSVPEDGGTPRDTSRIESMGPQEFRIRSVYEEGGQSVLRHAVSRVDMVCRNDGTRAATVTLHLDLSDDGKRTDYDNKPESGMKLRDFIFVQPPGHGWQQVDGTTERWVTTVSFDAAPGETKVGLSPWYQLKKYRTRVWGWEMPWWNYSVAEVRKSGAAFAKAFLTTIDEIQAGTVPVAKEQPTVELPRREMHEFSATGRAQVANPFRDAALVGEFISPSGKTNVIDGFCDGDDTWRLRFHAGRGGRVELSAAR